MSVYHVTINQGTNYEVEASTTAEAITIALDTYNTDNAALPDGCENNDTQSLCVCAEFAGDLVAAPVI